MTSFEENINFIVKKKKIKKTNITKRLIISFSFCGWLDTIYISAYTFADIILVYD